MQNQGLELKLAIKGSTKFKNQDEAAAALGMTRQNLAIYFKRKVLENAFLENVNSKLGIYLDSQRNPTNDFYGGSLEPYQYEITTLRKKVKSLEEILETNEQRILELKQALFDKDKLIANLEEKLKAPVVSVRKTGG